MHLTTERLVLREFQHTDFEAVHTYGSDPEVTRYTSFGPNTPAETEDFLTRAAGAALVAPRRSYDLAIVRISDRALIGGVGLRLGGTGLVDGCGTSSTYRGELGYVLRADAWGQGYAAEAGRAMVGFGFRRLGLHRIFAECHSANAASERVMEKIGMRREGLLREHALIKGEWWDVVVCGILRDEWGCQ
ncbi:MAG TPA: GNAT family protein [Armatimonadota bacterium]|jgi:RimJ/RimL family protein N-acetyltransferase